MGSQFSRIWLETGGCLGEGGLGSVEPSSSSLRSPPRLLSGIWWEYEKRLRSMPERLSLVSVKEDSIFLIHPSRTKALGIRWPFGGVLLSLGGQQTYV